MIMEAYVGGGVLRIERMPDAACRLTAYGDLRLQISGGPTSFTAVKRAGP